MPAGLTLLLLLGWTVLADPLFWTLSVLGIILIPSLIASIFDLLQKPDGVLLSRHFTTAGRSSGTRVAQAAFAVACMPYEAFYSLDAVVRKLTQAIMDAHERFIRRFPDQWYMFREMWPRQAVER